MGPLKARDETGPYEQCIALYPLMTHYSVGRFQPVLTFGLLRAHFQNSVTYGPLLAYSACGLNSACDYNPLASVSLTRWDVIMASSNTAY